MSEVRPKPIIVLITIITLWACIDPYTPKLNGYDSLLVVDGLITDENTSYTVRLSGTLQEQFGDPPTVSDATVFITDEAGDKSVLINHGNGIYKTDSTVFKGLVGRTYILHIITRTGDEYESDPCLMQSVPDIDNIYFEKDRELVNNETESLDGIRIYLDSKPGDNDIYYRWDFEETWKFRVPLPKKSIYVNEDLIVPVFDIKEYCWKSRKSEDVIIRTIYSGQPNQILRQPISFIAPERSDRLSVQYSILVKQYSISKKEYDFWNNMKQVNIGGGDIFAAQPYAVASNIHNLNDPREKVLGYFRVSAVKQKRKNIPFSEVAILDLPLYQYPCERIEKAPIDYKWGFGPPITWDEVYGMFCTFSDYYFVEPKYIPGTTTLLKMVFARPECANCELTGTRTRPDFWIDLN
jgi:hypothetical protein